MTITEFIEGRDVKINAVSNYIARHEAEFEGHIARNGKNTFLDKVAIEILEKKYPYPKPIEVIEDTESRAKLIKLQEAFIQLQAKSEAQAQLLAQAETTQSLLEDREIQLEKAEKRLEKAEERAERLDEDNRTLRSITAEKDQEIRELEGLLREEQSKTWWQKLRGK